MANNNFAFVGGSPFLPGSYMRVTPGTVLNCTTGCEVCYIVLNDDNDVPSSIPGSVRQHILNAIASQVPQPTPLGTELVFMKCP